MVALLTNCLAGVLVVCMCYIRPYLCSSTLEGCKGSISKTLKFLWSKENRYSARFFNLAPASRLLCFHPKWGVKGACRSVWGCAAHIYKRPRALLTTTACVRLTRERAVSIKVANVSLEETLKTLSHTSEPQSVLNLEDEAPTSTTGRYIRRLSVASICLYCLIAS